MQKVLSNKTRNVWSIICFVLAGVIFWMPLKPHGFVPDAMRAAGVLCLGPAVFWALKTRIAKGLIIAFFLFWFGASIFDFTLDHDWRALIGNGAMQLLIAMGFYIDRKKAEVD